MPAASETEWVTRFFDIRASKIDVQDDRLLFGYPIKFNSPSHDLGGFQERIDPRAVDRTLRSGKNVYALIDHKQESNSLLGSTESGTLKLTKDRIGLKSTIMPPDTSDVRDLIARVKAGLVKGMSFRFRAYPDGVRWTEEDGMPTRTVVDMEFSEVSVVFNPAYPDTEISARNAVADALAFEEYRSLRGWKPSVDLRARMARAGIR